MELVAQLRAISTEPNQPPKVLFNKFHLFVKTNDDLIYTSVRNILPLLNEDSLVEKLFKIKLIDRYQLGDEVMALLLGGDAVYLFQVMKMTWFFADLQDPEGFVRDVLPNFSVSTRMKVVNKYAGSLLDCSVCERLYDSMKSTYGVRAALPLLARCGQRFLESELFNIKIGLPPSLICSLLKTQLQVVYKYLSFLMDDKVRKNKQQREILSTYDGVFKKIVDEDVDGFVKLFEGYGEQVPFMQVGRRITKKLIKKEPEKFVQRYGKFQRIFKEKVVISCLSIEQVKGLLASSIMPSERSNFCSGSYTTHTALMALKSSVRGPVLMDSFHQKYKKRMTDEEVLHSLDSVWVEFLPPAEKIKWLERRIQATSDVSEIGDLVAMQGVEQSIPKLRKLIESQSDAVVRRNLAKNLVATLVVNNCSAGVPDLFAYFVKRFRNEGYDFLRIVASELCQSRQLLRQLELNQWGPIFEFIDIIKLNEESLYRSFCVREIFHESVVTCYTQNNDVDLYIRKYLDYEAFSGKDLVPEVIHACDSTPFHGQYLSWLLQELHNSKWVSTDAVKVKLFEKVCQFNSKNLGNVLQIPAWLVEAMEEILLNTETHWYDASLIIESVKKNPDEVLRESMRRKCFPQSYFTVGLAEYFLQSDPSHVVANMRVIFEKFVEGGCAYVPFCKKCRLYDSYGIPESIVRLCRVTLKIDEAEYDLNDSPMESAVAQPHAIKMLSILLKQNEYLHLIQRYVPKTPTIGDYTEETHDLLRVQEAVAKSFVVLPRAEEVLPHVWKFAVGDYLKYTTSSLVAICLKVPQEKILNTFKTWINSPVSVQKHILRLIDFIAPVEQSVKIFTDYFKSVKNTSLRLVLHNQLRKAFITEPCDDSFVTFKSIVLQLTAEDNEALNTLFDTENIDLSYVSVYLEMVWTLLNTDLSSALPDGEFKFLQQISQNVMENLNEDFLSVLFNHVMTQLPNSLNPLFSLYLLTGPTPNVQTARLNNAMTHLTPLIQTSWLQSTFTEKGHVFRTKRIITNKVSNLCQISHDEFKQNPSNLLAMFKSKLINLIDPNMLVRENFKLDLAIIYNNFKGNYDEVDYLKSVSALCVKYIKEASPQTHLILQELIVNSVPCTIHNKLAYELIVEDEPLCKLIAIKFLPSELTSTEMVTKCKSILDVLLESNHPAVRIAAHYYSASITLCDLE